MFLTLLVALIIRGNLLPGKLWSMGLDAALIIVTMITPSISFVLHFEMPVGVTMVWNQGKEYWDRLVPAAAPIHTVRFHSGRNGDINTDNRLGESDSVSDIIPPESFMTTSSAF